MKKLKIYLDTSVVSMLDQQDAPERMAQTHQLWDKIKGDKFDVVISDVVLREINDCDSAKRRVLLRYLAEIKYQEIATDTAVMITVAEQFVDFGILKQKSIDDCRHIAAAIVSDCDVIVSWNFRHIVNHKTITGVKTLARLNNYGDMLVYAPTVLVEGDQDD
ncbi:hypothetical protein FACS1894139_09310 [Planctomycetales bacterium]|nr:hypothetical protein FACS1894107_07290 [Planctomycetales bacterium]GHT05460.1 hypothetical protein FACS1894139_09310 [Planctomycetales bacterium]